MLPPGQSPDALLRVIGPLLAWAAARLPEALAPLVLLLGYPAVNALVLGVLILVRRGAADRRVAFLLAGLATALASWIVLHPTAGSELALVRGDHLLAAGFGGAAIRPPSRGARLRVLVAVSAGVLFLLAGPLPILLVYAGMTSGVAALRIDPGAGPGRTSLVQGAIMAVTGVVCLVAARRYGSLGLVAQGLFAFMLLRHLSWVVDVRRGAAGTFLDYCCFQLFYPCCYGATERFADFRARNADPGRYVDEARLFRVALRGAAYSGLWLVLPAAIDLERLLTVPGRLAFAAAYLLFFVRSAVFLMALWSTLEAMALCWGMRIHPNFAGILAARSPSQFWYAWRGTMTCWLIDYVYIPLGGNRAHHVRNVFAVFAVSAAWHAWGVPFLRPTHLPTALVPIGAWALAQCDRSRGGARLAPRRLHVVAEGCARGAAHYRGAPRHLGPGRHDRDLPGLPEQRRRAPLPGLPVATRGAPVDGHVNEARPRRCCACGHPRDGRRPGRAPSTRSWRPPWPSEAQPSSAGRFACARWPVRSSCAESGGASKARIDGRGRRFSGAERRRWREVKRVLADLTKRGKMDITSVTPSAGALSASPSF